MARRSPDDPDDGTNESVEQTDFRDDRSHDQPVGDHSFCDHSAQASDSRYVEPVDDLVDRLAAYDEQLRGGTAANYSRTARQVLTECDTDTSLIDCLQLLECAWPRSRTPDSPMMPSQIGRFKIDGVLGVGGFGVVYKAIDPTLLRPVALKVPRLHSMASKDLLARFQREAQAAASLDHPNIVPIHETGQDGPVCYIAAAYCSGPNLAEWLKSQTSPVPQHTAAMLVGKLAAAIAYSHSQGILHRDLKPSNVLLAPLAGASSGSPTEGLPFVPRLTDFGLAKLLEDNVAGDSIRTETISLGTPAYMAPEQTGQRDATIGAATDVYGLGVILYELLTSRPPFQGTNAADLFDQIRNDDPIAPSRLRREVSRDLETICLRCLDKNPARRIQTAQDLADELGRFLRGEPIVSRPINWFHRLQRWCRRRPMAAALIGVSTTAVIVIITMLTVHEQRLAKLNQDLASAAIHAKKLQHAAEDNERQAKDALYVSDIHRAAAAWKDDDSRVLTDLLDRHIPKLGEADRRGFEWRFLRRQASRDHRRLLDAGSALYTLASSPDKRLMATAGVDATVYLFDPETGAISRTIRTGQVEVNGVAFSPDGTELATAGDDGTIRFWNLATGNERLKIKAHPGKAYQLIITPDGHEIISCGDNPVIRVFDVRSGTEKRQLEGHVRDVQSLVPGAEGKTFLSTSSDSTWRLWDIGNWTTRTSSAVRDTIGPGALREDRNCVLVGSVDGELVSSDATTGAQKSIQVHADGLESIAIHPSGSLIAIGTGGGGIRLWSIDSSGVLTDSQISSWQAHQGRVFALAWSADGSRLISAGQDGRVLSWNQSRFGSACPQKIDVLRNSHFCLIPKSEFLFHSQVYPSPPAITIFHSRTHAMLKLDVADGFHEVAASPNGQFVAGCGEHQQLQLFRLDRASDGSPDIRPIARWNAPGELKRLLFAPDSKSIAVSHWHRVAPDRPADHFVLRFSIPEFEPIERIPIPHAKEFLFAPDNRSVLLSTQTGLTLWSLDDEQIIWDLPGAEQGFLDFSPDGRLVVTAGEQRVVTVRNSADGTTRYRMPGHRGRLRGLAFAPDGRTLATADSEGTLKFWNLATGKELMEIGHGDLSAERLEFSPDGQRLFLHLSPQRQHPRQDVDSIVIFHAPENSK